MTREEAIEVIEQDIPCERDTDLIEAFEMAIKALKQEPCEDAISREYLFKVLDDFCGHDRTATITLDTLADIVYDMPSVKPQEPKTGHWILADEQNKEDVENDNYRFICSECKCSDIHAKGTIVPYCWKCGARMESEGKE